MTDISTQFEDFLVVSRDFCREIYWKCFYFFLTVYGWGYQDYQEGFIQQILINNPTKQNNKICHQLSNLFTFNIYGKENTFLP